MKLNHALHCLRFQLGMLTFPLLEPLFQYWENRNTQVRRHLHQGLICFEKGETAITLLNLNMVLSLKPNHFMALVTRGRLHLKEGRCRLASQNLLMAHQVSPYRFTHYGLNNEYLRSLNMDANDLGASITCNFKVILELLGQLNGSPDELESPDLAPFSRERSAVEQRCAENYEQAPVFKRLTYDDLDREKFYKLGPITQQEIDDTDWDQLIQDFNS